MVPSSHLLPKEARQESDGDFAGEASIPSFPLFFHGAAYGVPHQGGRCAWAPTPPQERGCCSCTAGTSSATGQAWAGSAGHQQGWAAWRKQPSLLFLSTARLSGTAVGWTFVPSRLWQTAAGPSSREMGSRTGALAAVSKIPESHTAFANPARS